MRDNCSELLPIHKSVYTPLPLSVCVCVCFCRSVQCAQSHKNNHIAVHWLVFHNFFFLFSVFLYVHSFKMICTFFCHFFFSFSMLIRPFIRSFGQLLSDSSPTIKICFIFTEYTIQYLLFFLSSVLWVPHPYIRFFCLSFFFPLRVLCHKNSWTLRHSMSFRSEKCIFHIESIRDSVFYRGRYGKKLLRGDPQSTSSGW